MKGNKIWDLKNISKAKDYINNLLNKSCVKLYD